MAKTVRVPGSSSVKCTFRGFADSGRTETSPVAFNVRGDSRRKVCRVLETFLDLREPHCADSIDPDRRRLASVVELRSRHRTRKQVGRTSRSRVRVHTRSSGPSVGSHACGITARDRTLIFHRTSVSIGIAPLGPVKDRFGRTLESRSTPLLAGNRRVLGFRPSILATPSLPLFRPLNATLVGLPAARPVPPEAGIPEKKGSTAAA